ncbi:TPA: hypothetical protein CPT90_06205 [Candidatus Gastranaerophilales bacterium HUM_3]|jgi:hypothetical protein|nr:DUF3137 domain-containing protein [Acinetobacter sp.]DAA84542.1 MAG TPA: hypothetical protein CPT90_06205 [Candidatus Gastranaerophilales bacterium HUM_3]DAB00566.1 MAG TPA: hypothetical protein CPT89_08025 [Candidatus Gastranaerophilales bacterium HUM_11]
MSIVSEYTKIFQSLKPELDKAEIKRIKYLTTFIVGVVVTLVLFSGFLLAMFGLLSSAIMLVFLFSSILAGYLSYLTIRNFKRYIKANFMSKFLKCFKEIRRISDENSARIFSTKELKASNLFSTFNTIKVDDAFKGNYNGVDYKITEIKLIQEGSKNSTTAFKGVILSVPSNKTIKANTIIATKRDMNIRNYPTGIIASIILVPILICEWFLSLKFSSDIDNFIKLIVLTIITLIIICSFIEKQKSMQTVKLESTNFEKRFNVFSKNQVEARYLLTPTFIEKFTRLYTAFGTNKAKCSFYKDFSGNDRIMFAISTNRDLFEPGNLFTPINEPKYMFLSDFTSIFNMIEFFKLDEKTKL